MDIEMERDIEAQLNALAGMLVKVSLLGI